MNTKCLIPLPLVVLATLFCAPASGFAQTILLSADNFAVLGGAAVTSTGATAITGNVGSTTAVTGFPPGTITVNGSPATPIVGGATGQGELDLITASDGLAAMASTGFISNGDLGGLTLSPGVYTFGSSTVALDGTLTLNANGNANAVWVFNISTTLTTSSGSMVVLENTVNGGVGDGIFWNAGTTITIGADSTTLGNYLAGTGIAFDGGDLGDDGRALAQAGVTFASATVLNAQGGNGNGYSSGLMYNNEGAVVPTSVPEPAAFLWLAPLGALACAIWRRRSVRK
jgi:hypothetical protein